MCASTTQPALAYVEVHADEKGADRGRVSASSGRVSTPSTASRVERVMTDNGTGYRSMMHALACRALGLRHLRTRLYRPRTNGKAERFIRTMLSGGPTARSTAPQQNAPAR